MASTRQREAAKRNIKKAAPAAKKQRTLAHLPRKTKTALGQQASAVARRKRTGGSSPKTRQELYDMAKRRNLPGRSKMGRDELARAARRLLSRAPDPTELRAVDRGPESCFPCGRQGAVTTMRAVPQTSVKEAAVPTYVVLGKFTQQGAQKSKDIPQRRAAAMEAAKAVGITWRDAWLTMGQFDVVMILEAPDDEAMAKFALQIALRGNLSTQTMRAFTQAEADAIVASL